MEYLNLFLYIGVSIISFLYDQNCLQKLDTPVYGNYFQLPNYDFEDLSRLKDFAERPMEQTPLWNLHVPKWVRAIGITGKGTLKEMKIDQKTIWMLEKRVYLDSLDLHSQIYFYTNDSGKYKIFFKTPIFTGEKCQVNQDDFAITISRKLMGANRRSTIAVLYNDLFRD